MKNQVTPLCACILTISLALTGCSEEQFEQGGNDSDQGSSQESPVGLSTELRLVQDHLTPDTQALVEVAVSNVTSEPLKLLKWQLAEENLSSDAFTVTRNNEPVEYFGPVVKRAEPTEDDYVTLMPGEQFKAKVNLGSAYDVAVTGQYTVALKSYHLTDHSLLRTKSSLKDKTVALTGSNELGFSVQGYATTAESEQARSLELAAKSTIQCSSSQRSEINAAEPVAKSMAKQSWSNTYYNDSSSDYRTWFGTNQYHSTVVSTFNKMHSALDDNQVDYDCSCPVYPSAYAYVYPNDPYTIYLCGAFWNADVTGYNSQAGTILHELSHFNVVGATDDHVYGVSGAKQLAQSSPYEAANNADSYEYFAESTYDGDSGTGNNSGQTYNGYLQGQGSQSIQPDGSWFKHDGGSVVASLSGPSNADFDLKLERWDSESWVAVTKSEESSSSESITRTLSSGYYRFVVYSYSGSGNFTFTLKK